MIEKNLNTIHILGSGTSTGVPILGCDCKVCQSEEINNQRLRTSVLLETVLNNTILVDATPDVRTQLLRTKTKMIDATIITHDHADHIHGIDDLRSFCFRREDELPCFTYSECAERLRIKFPYIFDRENFFKNRRVLGGGIPRLSLNNVSLEGKQKILDDCFEFFNLPHGYIKSMGFVHASMGYIIDCNTIPPDLVSSLAQKNLELLILDCNGPKPHQTHLHLESALKYAQQIKAKKTRFIHITHDHDHNELKNIVKKVDPSFGVAYDGEILHYSN